MRELRNFLPGIVTLIQSSGIITIVFGAGQFLHYMIGYYKGGGMGEVYAILFGSGWGLSVLVGGVFGFIGLLIGGLVKRDMDRMMSLYRNILPDDEMLMQARKSLQRSSMIGTVFLTISVIFMLVAVTFLPLPS
ncbi:hypothetical protein [Sulfuracidifex tepidarius]|uniref:hypothetical protein n=1 Tax=Sulfuracidifex tepidarius TaxID=1294262 RepID=UPI0006D232FC|nr:hypothetical protein [Sulfuracidifex tepidarius]